MIVVTTDLRAKLFPVRDQGRRNSCLLFATSAAHETHITAKDFLSPEYLYYHAIKRCAHATPNSGTTFASTSDALQMDGQPDEAAWPYTAQAVVPWMPPTVLTPIYKATMTFGKMSFDEITHSLDQYRPVILGMIITSGFQMTTTNGVIPDVAGDRERGGHAVLSVGHGSVDGKKALLVRNSWGTGWGDAGHGWMSEDYLNLHMQETAYVA